VFLSLLGAEKNKVVPHAKIEELLQAGPAACTLLRAGFFMQNLSTTHRRDIVDYDDIFIPAGKGKTAFVDTRDLAAVAALAVTEPGHENKAYPLTGGESLDYGEVAAVLSDVLGRRISYNDPSPLRFAWRMRRRGGDWSYIGVMSAIYMTTRLGLAATIHPELATLLGRTPTSFRQFAEDNIQVWQK
jgi:nucleoside-diphosphate-sugar epimerase